MRDTIEFVLAGYMRQDGASPHNADRFAGKVEGMNTLLTMLQVAEDFPTVDAFISHVLTECEKKRVNPASNVIMTNRKPPHTGA